MIQLIAVHLGGALPVVMELDTEGLNFVHRHALEHLPRSPSGVPELRGLIKSDGALQFKFKLAPEKVAPSFLPELLALWDAKFTEATLKQMAKKSKAERDAASAAGLWRDGVEKGDLNAMHQNCSPNESQVFQEKLASKASLAKQKARAGKRAPKPKLLDAVIDATTTVNVLTGERVQMLGAAESAVTKLQAQALVAQVKARVAAPSEQNDRQEFADPLEQAGTQNVAKVPVIVPVDAPATLVDKEPAGMQPQVVHVGTTARSEPKQHATPGAKAPRLVEMSAQDLFKHLEKGTPGVFTDEEAHRVGDFDLFADHPPTTQKALQIEGEKLAGIGSSQSLIETTVTDAGSGQLDGFDADAWEAEHQNQNQHQHQHQHQHQQQGQSSDHLANFDPFMDFAELSAAHGTPGVPLTTAVAVGTQETATATTYHNAAQMDAHRVTIELMPTQLDWTALVSFRLDNHRNDARAVTLQSGELFEALGYLQLAEPLGVKVEWLLDAVGDGDMVTQDVQALRAATDWLRAELDWRGHELMRWLGKNDLVTPLSDLKGAGGHAEKAQRVGNAKMRPAGWVAAGCQLAGLAQAISLDIAMLELTVRDVERGLEGMPQWAIDVMQHIQAFSKTEAAVLPAVSRSAPGAVFRDVWREELQRIDRWCAAFTTIKIARQIGLFGQQPADHKLLVRLEHLIKRTHSWRASPAQASRVLAVWLAFVLSLDHDNRPAQTVAQPAIAPARPDGKNKLPVQKAGAVKGMPSHPLKPGAGHRRRASNAPAVSAGAEQEEMLHV